MYNFLPPISAVGVSEMTLWHDHHVFLAVVPRHFTAQLLKGSICTEEQQVQSYQGRLPPCHQLEPMQLDKCLQIVK